MLLDLTIETNDLAKQITYKEETGPTVNIRVSCKMFKKRKANGKDVKYQVQRAFKNVGYCAPDEIEAIEHTFTDAINKVISHKDKAKNFFEINGYTGGLKFTGEIYL